MAGAAASVRSAYASHAYAYARRVLRSILGVTHLNAPGDTFSRQESRTDVGYGVAGAAVRPLRRSPGPAQPLHALCAVHFPRPARAARRAEGVLGCARYAERAGDLAHGPGYPRVPAPSVAWAGAPAVRDGKLVRPHPDPALPHRERPRARRDEQAHPVGHATSHPTGNALVQDARR